MILTQISIMILIAIKPLMYKDHLKTSKLEQVKSIPQGKLIIIELFYKNVHINTSVQVVGT